MPCFINLNISDIHPRILELYSSPDNCTINVFQVFILWEMMNVYKYSTNKELKNKAIQRLQVLASEHRTPCSNNSIRGPLQAS